MSDDRVKTLRKLVEEKTQALGNEPKAVYKTNLKFLDINIMVLKLDALVELLATVLAKKEKVGLAAQMIGVNSPSSYDDLIDDIVLRGKILNYKVKKAELDQLNRKLDDLRSEDLKKSDALDELEQLLK